VHSATRLENSLSDKLRVVEKNSIEVEFDLRSNTSPSRDRFNLVSWSQSLFMGDGRTLPSIMS
jgi:hypothetical protein